MRPNKLRALLQTGQPTLGTRLQSLWPTVVELLGYTGMFDYVEFLAEYAPFTLPELENFCRAAELHDLGTMIKVDQEPSQFLAQRGIGAGFQSVLFADCRSAEDARRCVAIVRPDTPEDGGLYGAATRRFAISEYGGSAEYVQYLRDVVVALMIEKAPAVDQLEEILTVPGIDMIQWGPADFSMSIGRPGERNHPQVREAERYVLETCRRAGVAARVEINTPEEAIPYLELGIRHFSLSNDLKILAGWWQYNGQQLRAMIG